MGKRSTQYYEAIIQEALDSLTGDKTKALKSMNEWKQFSPESEVRKIFSDSIIKVFYDCQSTYY